VRSNVDGWLVSFHEREPSCQPLTGLPLGLYFCDESIVDQQTFPIPACDFETVNEYETMLRDCCLVHSNIDNRDGSMPAVEDAFLEVQCSEYSLDIQAVIGRKFVDDGSGVCQEVVTGRSAKNDFWGWHSTSVARECIPFRSQMTMSGSDWLYGPWSTVETNCGPSQNGAADMSFELLTDQLGGIDCNSNGLPDACEPDCNSNGFPDDCDVANGEPDINGNGIPDACEVQPPFTLAGEAGFDKDRYVSFNPIINGIFAVATAVNRIGSGTTFYVDCTTLQDKGADGWYAKLIDGPLPPAPHPTYYCNLSAVSELHVRGCSVVPGNTYAVNMSIDGSIFSTALFINTTPPALPRNFGDTVGSFVGSGWTVPEGIVTTNDIVAAVKKFALDPDAAIMARLDTDGLVPNAVISSGDILRAVRAFAGDFFGFGVTGCPTGTCIPPQAGACE